MIHTAIKAHMPQLIELFTKHKVKNAYVFGSVVTDRFGVDSDVGFLINFMEGIDPVEKGVLWWNLHDSLRDSLQREVDLVSESALKNPYFIKDINETKVQIYG